MSIYPDTVAKAGVNELSTNAANEACVAGTYTGEAAAVIRFPAGYTPPELNLSKSSPAKPITCG